MYIEFQLNSLIWDSIRDLTCKTVGVSIRDYFKENFGLHIYGEREPITGVWGGAEHTVGSGGRAPGKGVPLKLEAFYALEVRRKCQNCPLFLYFAKSNVQVSVTI